MTTQNLERVEKPVETPLKAEEVTPSKPAEASSLEDKTPTLRESPEFKEELERAQSGWDKRNQILQTKLTQSEARAKEATGKHDVLAAEREADNTLTSLLKKYEESGGDPEVVEELGKALRSANKTKAEADRIMKEAVQAKHDVFMANKAVEYSKQYGIPVEELFDCENEYEMQIKGLEYQIANPKQPGDEPKKKVDSLLGAGAGVDLSKLSADEKIQRSLKQIRK